MKKIVKVLALTMALAAVFTLAACGGNSAENEQEARQAFADVMESFKNGDTAVIGEYVDLGGDPALADALAASLSGLGYEIKSVTADGSKATVNAEVTMIDSSKVMQKYIESVAALVSSPDYQSRIDTMTKEEYDELMNEQLINILSDGGIGTVTNEELVEMVRENGKWKLSDNTLPDKLIGNTLNAINQIKQ